MNKPWRSDPLSELGTRLSPSDRPILRVLIMYSDVDNPLTISEITQKVRAEDGVEVSPNWVYKCTEKLAEMGLVRVDRLRRPAVHFTSQETLARGLEELIDSRIAELLERERSIDEEAALLDSVSAVSMAEALVFALATPKHSQADRLVLGIDSVVSTVVDVLTREARPGSIIRFMQSADAVPKDTAALGTFERGVFDAIDRGVAVHALITTTTDVDRSRSALLDFVEGVKDPLAKGLTTGGLQLRLHPSPARTYRMMVLDTRVMLLFMSESYIPEAAMILRGPHDTRIIEDAIRSFREKWDNSLDVGALILRGVSRPERAPE